SRLFRGSLKRQLQRHCGKNNPLCPLKLAIRRPSIHSKMFELPMAAPRETRFAG
ncbi:hypothetical protein TSAR_009967, partial [Trichomalopsis sarcophagae]